MTNSGNWASYKKKGCIAPVGSARLPTHLRGGGVDRPMVTGGGTNANEADPEEIEGVTLPQVYNDPELERNQKLYLSFDVAAGAHSTLASRTMQRPSIGTSHWTLHFAPS